MFFPLNTDCFLQSGVDYSFVCHLEVGYAIATARHADLNVLLHVSVLGGIACALFGWVVMLALAASPVAYSLVDPSAASNRALIEAGCSLIPTSEEVFTQVKGLWFLRTAAWLPNFATKGLLGFFIGTKQYLIYCLPLLVSATVPVILWFMAFAHNSLSTLDIIGVAYTAGDWLIGLVFVAYFVFNSSLRERYSLKLWGGSSGRIGWSKVVKEVVLDGLALMLVDLAI
jgi:hypothetical protein